MLVQKYVSISFIHLTESTFINIAFLRIYMDKCYKYELPHFYSKLGKYFSAIFLVLFVFLLVCFCWFFFARCFYS